jgi:hypothetical protein
VYKFETGDKVYVVDNGSLDMLQKEYLGTTGVVQEDDDNPFVLMDSDGEKLAFHEDKLVLMDLKEGDKVEILGTGNGFLEQYIGTIGEVQSVMLSGCSVKVHGGTDDGIWGFIFKNLQKVEEDKTMEFKVGDEVEILSTGTDFLEQYIGTIGKVMSVIGDSCWVKVHGGTKDGDWGFNNKNLRKVQEILPVGTKVRIVAQQYEHMDSIGQVGVIVENDVRGTHPYRVEFCDGKHWVYNRSELEVLPQFSKVDLKTGMLVQTRDGEWRLVMLGVECEEETRDVLARLFSWGFFDIEDLTDDLMNTGCSGASLDVMKVATVRTPGIIFKALREGTSIEDCTGFTVVYERPDDAKEQRKKELQGQIEKIQSELEELR